MCTRVPDTKQNTINCIIIVSTTESLDGFMSQLSRAGQATFGTKYLPWKGGQLEKDLWPSPWICWARDHRTRGSHLLLTSLCTASAPLSKLVFRGNSDNQQRIQKPGIQSNAE